MTPELRRDIETLLAEWPHNAFSECTFGERVHEALTAALRAETPPLMHWKCATCADSAMRLTKTPKHPPICSCGAEMAMTAHGSATPTKTVRDVG